MTFENTIRELEQSRIIKHGTEPQYFLNGLCDGIPYINPTVLKELSDYIASIIPSQDIDRIVCVEAMGIPIATVLSCHLNIPLTIIRKKRYNLPTEYEITQNTSYKKNKKLYINGLTENMNILLIDDVISTGNTIREIIKGLTDLKINILHTVILVEIINKYYKKDINYTSLLQIKIKNDKVEVIK